MMTARACTKFVETQDVHRQDMDKFVMEVSTRTSDGCCKQAAEWPLHRCYENHEFVEHHDSGD